MGTSILKSLRYVHEYKLQGNQRKTGKAMSSWCQKDFIIPRTTSNTRTTWMQDHERAIARMCQGVPGVRYVQETRCAKDPQIAKFHCFSHFKLSHHVSWSKNIESLLFSKQTPRNMLKTGWDHPTHQTIGICCVSSSRPSCMWRLGCTGPLKLSTVDSISWKLGLF